jgi:hypothetical protein
MEKPFNKFEIQCKNLIKHENSPQLRDREVKLTLLHLALLSWVSCRRRKLGSDDSLRGDSRLEGRSRRTQLRKNKRFVAREMKRHLFFSNLVGEYLLFSLPKKM